MSSRVWLRGLSAINKRTKAAREIVKGRAELMQDLGGEPTLTAAQRTRIETLVRTKLLLEHLDAQLLEHGTLFAKKGHLRATVKAILSERNRMADSVERGLVALGQRGKADGPALPPIADLLVPLRRPQSSGRPGVGPAERPMTPLSATMAASQGPAAWARGR